MAKVLLDAQPPLSADNVEALVLYNSAASPCVRRVHITLIEKGLNYDTVEVDLANMEQRSPSYLSLNPSGYVPTISHGEQVIFDSATINEYLDAQFLHAPLFPSSALERAQVRMWIGSEEAMSKDFRPLLYQRVMGPIQHVSRSLKESQQINRRSTSDPADLAWGDKVWNMQVLTHQQEMQQERKLMEWLDLVEEALENQDYLVADQFTQADICVFPRVVMYSYLGLEIEQSRYPNVLRWIERLEKRPSFEASMSAQAKKLRKMATSPLLPKLRRILKKTEKKRSLMDKFFIWGLGRIMRKLQKVEVLLAAPAKPRDFPMPKKQLLPVKPTLNQKPVFSKTDSNIEIFGSSLSPHSQRIVTLLNFLGLAYSYHEIDLKNEKHKKSNFVSLNPLAQVPVLKHGEHVIYDSRAIAEYLLENFDHQQLWWGKTSWQAAQNRMWLGMEAGTHKEFKPLWDKYILNKKDCSLDIKAEYSAINRIEKKLKALEETLMNNEFLCGEQIRFADIAWFTRLESMQLIPGFSIEKFPNLTQWYVRVKNTTEKISQEIFGK